MSSTAASEVIYARRIEICLSSFSFYIRRIFVILAEIPLELQLSSVETIRKKNRFLLTNSIIIETRRLEFGRAINHFVVT